MTTPEPVAPLPQVDMSPEAIDRRLAQVGALYQLMLSLGAAELAPPPPAADPAADR